MKKTRLLFLAIAINFWSQETFAQTTKVIKHENVVYGMISGMALLMDVYQPAKSNHLGIVYIIGSAWGYGGSYQKVYNHIQLKDDYVLDTAYSGKWIRSLINRGYTVFVINHRFVPKFHFPDIFYDCQRAVRFIRYNAKKYSIDAKHIGAMGHSSGGNLSAMLAVTDTTIVHPESPIDSVSSKVQAVVTLAAPFVLSERNESSDTLMRNFYLNIVQSYIGDLPWVKRDEIFLPVNCDQASPITYVSKDDAPFLIYYSENDPVISMKQAVMMCKKLKDIGVPFKEFKNTTDGHDPTPNMNEVDNWFRQYLK